MKIFKKKLWEVLSVVMASILVFLMGGYDIAMSQSAAINTALGIAGSSIARSTDEKYQYYKRSFTTTEEVKAYYTDICEQIEAEGLVLLKNDNNALPLSEGDKVSCFLSGSVRFNYGSSGSSAIDSSAYKDLKTALTEQGLSVNEALWEYYAGVKGRTKSGETYKINEPGFEDIDSAAVSKSEEYNVAIVTFARDSGEGADVSVSRTDGEDKSYLAISTNEADVLEQLTSMKKSGKIRKIIVLLNSSSPLELDFLYRDGIDVDACMWVGNVGVSGIDAVAKALTGKVVPSGKLSDTYLRDNFSSPAMMQQSYNYLKSFAGTYTNAEALGLNETQGHYGVYTEGIYVGYRYYETRYTD